jgi:hypothetical protein
MVDAPGAALGFIGDAVLGQGEEPPRHFSRADMALRKERIGFT